MKPFRLRSPFGLGIGFNVRNLVRYDDESLDDEEVIRADPDPDLLIDEDIGVDLALFYT